MIEYSGYDRTAFLNESWYFFLRKPYVFRNNNEIAQEHRLGRIRMSNPYKLFLLETLRWATNKRIQILLWERDDIFAFINFG